MLKIEVLISQNLLEERNFENSNFSVQVKSFASFELREGARNPELQVIKI
jgi:hypothetical protein